MAHAILNVTGSTGSADAAGRGGSVRTRFRRKLFCCYCPWVAAVAATQSPKSLDNAFLQPRRGHKSAGPTQLAKPVPAASLPT